MGAGQIIALVILCAIPAGVWLRLTFREKSARLDNDTARILANGLDDFDEDGTDPQMEARIVGRHRKQ